MGFLENVYWAIGVFFAICATILFVLLVDTLVSYLRKPVVRTILIILYIPVVLLTKSLSAIAKRI